MYLSSRVHIILILQILSAKDKEGNSVVSKKDISKIMTLYDKDGNRELDFEEFTAMIKESM